MSVLRSALARRFISSVNAGVFRRGGDGIESPLQFPGTAAWYDVSDLSSMRNDAGAVPATGEGIKLVSDKSGNSSVNVLCLNGVNGNYASAPDSAAVSITGDLTIVWGGALVDWTPAATKYLGGKLLGTGNQRSYRLGVKTDGTLELGYSLLGTATLANPSTVAPTVSDYGYLFVAATRRASDGVIKFYTAPWSAGSPPSFPSGWTQLGTNVAGTSGNIFDSTALLEIGSVEGGASGDNTNGNISYFDVRNGYDGAGTIQFQTIFANQSKLAPSFTESSSNAATVTIHNSGSATGARISGARDLYQGVAASQPILTIAAGGNYLTFDGSNDYLKAAAFALAQPETVYFVGSQVSWTAGEGIIDGNADLTGISIFQNGAGVSPSLRATSDGANFFGANSGLALNTPGVLCGLYNGASSALRVNRTSAVTGSGGTTAANGVTIGARGAGTSNFSNITASEVLVYSTADSTPVQDAKILYLGRHNGIAV